MYPTIFQTLVIKYFKIILFKVIWCKKISKICYSLDCKHKINKSSTQLSYNIESFACILKTFATTIGLSINILIYFGICSTSKLSK